MFIECVIDIADEGTPPFGEGVLDMGIFGESVLAGWGRGL